MPVLIPCLKERNQFITVSAEAEGHMRGWPPWKAEITSGATLIKREKDLQNLGETLAGKKCDMIYLGNKSQHCSEIKRKTKRPRRSLRADTG